MNQTTQAFRTYELAERHLHAGSTLKGCEALSRRLEAAPEDQQARFALGILEFLGGFERLSQSLYSWGFGAGSARSMHPLLSMIPVNPAPEPVDCDRLRGMLECFLADMKKADASFALVVEPSVKVPLRLGPGRLDLDGDGIPERPLSEWLGALQAGGQVPPELLVCFDRGDASWFRGYCNLATGVVQTVLAFEQRELFENLGHLVFPLMKTPMRGFPGSRSDLLLDGVAFIHLLRFPVKHPGLLTAALADFELAIEQDLESWEHILAETDDDHEWIPNPRQTGAFGVRVTQEMVDAWRGILLQVRELLAGRLLIPFWRGGGRGINLRRFFLEPRTFDAVLWVQGLAALPYLEHGRVLAREDFREAERIFGRNLLGFALWFN